MFTDRPPEDGQTAEVRTLERRAKRAEFTISDALDGDAVSLTARNGFHVPIEVAIVLNRVQGVQYPNPDDRLRWVVPANTDLMLIRLAVLGGATVAEVEYEFVYVPGDPRASHQPGDGYRAPFAVGSDYLITQAHPDTITHRSTDSRYAVDIAMPVGTDIVAARSGIVFDVAANNYRSGTDLQRDGGAANLVRILHDDGTYATYAHLNWNSIRVQNGDHVETGEYIADSGNTGFSSGPHLHFAVQKNAGLRMDSLPVRFIGANTSRVVPATGNILRAY